MMCHFTAFIFGWVGVGLVGGGQQKMYSKKFGICVSIGDNLTPH